MGYFQSGFTDSSQKLNLNMRDYSRRRARSFSKKQIRDLKNQQITAGAVQTKACVEMFYNSFSVWSILLNSSSFSEAFLPLS
jgi:hypothetical protein